MRQQSSPKSIESILQSFGACFTRPSYANFVALVSGWLVCRTRRWITRVFSAAGLVSKGHHARFYRFFSTAKWQPDALGRVLFDLLLPFLPETLDVLVDDTLCRRNGPRVFGISMHRDGAQSAYGASAGMFNVLACGHSWVVLAVRVPLPWGGGLAVPLLARLYRSPKRCSKVEYRKRTELAREMLEVLAGWVPARRVVHLLGDREYACKTLLRGLDPTIHFTGPLPMDAKLFAATPAYRGMGRPRLRGRRLASPVKRAADRRTNWDRLDVVLYGARSTRLLIKTWTCLWYGPLGQRLVRVVVTRDPKGNYKDRAFFSTCHDARPDEILQRFAGRWSIEVCFRDSKQLFGLSDPQNGWSRGRRRRGRPRPGPQPRGNRGRVAVQRTAPFAWIVYGITVVWYLRQDRWQEDVAWCIERSPWRKAKSKPSLSDMLDALKTEILIHRLSSHPLPDRTPGKTRQVLMDLGLVA